MRHEAERGRVWDDHTVDCERAVENRQRKQEESMRLDQEEETSVEMVAGPL